LSNESLSAVTVIVPATTANLGPGFDCLGAALARYNQFRFTRLDPAVATHPLELVVSGAEADRMAGPPEENLVYRSLRQVFDRLGQPVPPLRLEIKLGIPLARGLGSSATAIAAGVVGANYLLGNPLAPQQVVQLAVELEGHPDNIVPALLGGGRLCVQRDDGMWIAHDLPWDAKIVPVIAVPDFELSTEEARRALPPHYARADAVFNAANLGLLLHGLATGRGDLLTVAMRDRIHQPYRIPLIQGFDSVRQAAIAAGAFEVVISGAGPTLLALTSPEAADAVAAAMQQTWAAHGITATANLIALDPQGTRLRP
jgi:homoserine kinase